MPRLPTLQTADPRPDSTHYVLIACPYCSANLTGMQVASPEPMVTVKDRPVERLARPKRLNR